MLTDKSSLSLVHHRSHEEKNVEPVIHQVMLVDLNCLAELWEISSTTLGLDINEKGHLVPKLIDENDDKTSVAEMSAMAEKEFPYSHELDIVVQICKTNQGNMIGISTLDQVATPEQKVCQFRWWRFTDSYVGQMH